MLPPPLLPPAQRLFQFCLDNHLRLVLAESCTGGLAAAALTAIPGSSRVLDRGFVVYSNESKTEELAVPAELIAQFGAVSEQVARAMSIGALAAAHGRAQLSVAITGVAGPEGSEAKPPGLVHVAAARAGAEGGEPDVWHERHDFGPLGRDEVRLAAACAALELAARRLESTE